MYSFFKNILHKETKKGFTLVELLVAASILISALGAPLYVGVQGVVIATEAQNKIAATYLAEEGIELIRNQRDSNLLKIISGDTTVAWDDFKYGSNTCVVNPNQACLVGRDLSDFVSDGIYFENCLASTCSKNLQQIAHGSGAYKYYDYGYGGTGTDSIFKRTIKMSYPVSGNDQQIYVQSIVEWRTRGTTKSLTVEEYLFDYGFDND